MNKPKKILYRYRIYKEKGKSSFNCENEVYVAPKEDIFPFGAIPKNVDVWTVAYDDQELREWILFFSFNKYAITSFVKGLNFCMNLNDKWSTFFKTPGDTNEKVVSNSP